MKVTAKQEKKKDLIWHMWSVKKMTFRAIAKEVKLPLTHVYNTVNAKKVQHNYKESYAIPIGLGNAKNKVNLKVNDEMEYGTPVFKCTWDDLSKAEQQLATN